MTQSRSDELMKLSKVQEKCSYSSGCSLVNQQIFTHSGLGGEGYPSDSWVQFVTAGLCNGGLLGLCFPVVAWSEFCFVCLCVSQHTPFCLLCLSPYL